MIDADWQRAAGKGTHATLSRFDMHNTLIAAGPDFKQGQTDDLPSGNVDLAPTILRILGIKPSQKMDGRILSEAMTGSRNGGPQLARRRLGEGGSAEPAFSPKGRNRKQSKLQNIFHPECGDNRFKSRASVRRSTWTKATAGLLRMKERRYPHARSNAGAGAIRESNQISNNPRMDAS